VSTKPTPKAVIEKAGGVTALAKVFGISHGAVSQWRNLRRLPRGRLMELQYQHKPEWFNKDGSLRS